jgi:hypothetical protein
MRIRILLLAFSLIAFLQPQASFAAVPSVPSGVTARVGTTSAFGAGTVTVSWTKVSGATAYAARLTKTSDNVETVLSVTGETNNEVVFNGLSGGSTYVVQVRAFQVTDASEWSSNTLSAVPKTAPRAPNKPTVVAGIGKATVSWTAVSASDNGGLDITSYVVKEINTALSNTAASDASSYEFTGLTAGATAEFTVTAINSANTTGTTSVKSDAVTIPSTATLMSAPRIAGTGNAGEARVSWLPPTSNGGSSLLSFTVKLIKDGVDLVSRVVSDITETFSTFTSLATGTYTAKVTSTNGVGTSAFSTESGNLNVTAAVIATAAPTPSATPSATATTPSGGSSGGGGFGGGGGGGFGGGGGGAATDTATASASPTPSASPSPSASPTPTIAPSPKPSASASPTSSPTSSVVTTASPSPATRPGVTTNAKGEVTKTTTFAIPTKVSGPVKSLTLTGSKATISTSLKNAVQPAIPSVKKGTVIKVVIKGADGKSYTIASTKTKTTGTYKSPAIKFSKPGTYQVTVMIGKIKKVITYKISK